MALKLPLLLILTPFLLAPLLAAVYPLTLVINKISNLTNETNCWICSHQDQLEDDIGLLGNLISLEMVASTIAQYWSFSYTIYTTTKNDGVGGGRPVAPRSMVGHSITSKLEKHRSQPLLLSFLGHWFCLRNPQLFFL